MGSKMTFSCEWRNSFDNTGPITKHYNFTTTAESLPEILEDFEMFLKGCGFQIPEGHLIDVVEDPSYNPMPDVPFGLDEQFAVEDPEWSTPEWDTPQENTGHSKFYFDTERNK